MSLSPISGPSFRMLGSWFVRLIGNLKVGALAVVVSWAGGDRVAVGPRGTAPPPPEERP